MRIEDDVGGLLTYLLFDQKSSDKQKLPIVLLWLLLLVVVVVVVAVVIIIIVGDGGLAALAASAASSFEHNPVALCYVHFCPVIIIIFVYFDCVCWTQLEGIYKKIQFVNICRNYIEQCV